ncbi:beta-galactosidase trimerization domain-containing protein [Planctomycetota bacterium]
MNTGSVELSKANYKHGETVRGKASVKLSAKFSGTLEVFWQDSHGRIIERIEKKAKFPSSQTVRFSFKLNKFPMAVVHHVVLQITDDLLVRRWRSEARFTATPPRYTWNDYEVIMWGSKQEWATEEFMEQLKQNGITAAMAYAVKPGRKRRDTNWLADGDLRFYVENVCQIGWDNKIVQQFFKDFSHKAYRNGLDQVPDKKYLIRKPCFNDPAHWAACRKRIRDEVKARDEYMPMAYNIGDEQSIAYFTSPYDFCFSKHCLKEFRNWLRAQYKSIGAMNRSWGTDYTSWNKVMPLTREEIRARAGASYAPWADHRDFMDTQIVRFVKRLIGYFHEVAPGAHVGIEGTQKPTAYGGFDYWKLMQAPLSFLEAYDIGGARKMAASFNDNRCPILSLAGVGRDPRAQAWQGFFGGNRSIVLWWMPAFANADGTATESAKAQAPVWNEMTGGIAKLLDLDMEQNDQVAIHYSAASVRAKWITMKEIPFTGDHEITNVHDLEKLATMRLIEDMGFTYKYVSYEQVEKGELKNYKALILPNSIALSDREVKQIKAFVKKGGLLIADYEAGWMDEHCRTRRTGALDDVFGISHDSLATEPFDTRTEKGHNSYWFEIPPSLGNHQVTLTRNNKYLTHMGRRLYYPAVESKLRPTTGEALGREGKTPAFIVNKYGKGLTVYLNFRLLYYAKHRATRQNQTLADITVKALKPFFGHAGIKPGADLMAPLGVERIMFQDGRAEYHGLRRNLELGEQQGLGEIEGEKTVAETPVNVRLNLRKAGHVYNLRTGEYLGNTNAIGGKLEHPDPLLYSVLPYKVEDLDIAAKDTCLQGARVTVRASLHTRRKVTFERHVFKCRLYGPDTRERTGARKNIVSKNGTATYRFDLALNDMAGAWKVIIRDVATGTEREHTFGVSPQNNT